MSALSRGLVACLLNISEARCTSVVEKVASSALVVGNHETPPSHQSTQERSIKSAVLNIFQDYDYNRSVITIVSSPENIGESVINACSTAYDLIDLSAHDGGHPRLGAVDLVPLHPISGDVSLEECGHIARDIAKRLTTTIAGMSAFLFGTADVPARRGLVERRKEVQWYRGQHHSGYTGIQADVGAQPTPRYGLTGIGAIPYIMNCNVTIDTTDVNFGIDIAAKIRATTPGGLPGVQSMAFAHEGKVEIACNIQGLCRSEGEEAAKLNPDDFVCSFGEYYHVQPAVLEHRVSELAAIRGVKTVGTALVGFTPADAYRLACHALTKGPADFWRYRNQRTM